ncbi:unnamed protein product, partial [Cyprideis torosa]
LPQPPPLVVEVENQQAADPDVPAVFHVNEVPVEFENHEIAEGHNHQIAQAMDYYNCTYCMGSGHLEKYCRIRASHVLQGRFQRTNTEGEIQKLRETVHKQKEIIMGLRRALEKAGSHSEKQREKNKLRRLRQKAKKEALKDQKGQGGGDSPSVVVDLQMETELEERAGRLEKEIMNKVRRELRQKGKKLQRGEAIKKEQKRQGGCPSVAVDLPMETDMEETPTRGPEVTEETATRGLRVTV